MVIDRKLEIMMAKEELNSRLDELRAAQDGGVQMSRLTPGGNLRPVEDLISEVEARIVLLERMLTEN